MASPSTSTTMPASPLLELEGSVAIVCHDAGAANLVFAWMLGAVALHPAMAEAWRLVVAGPAERIWSSIGDDRVRRFDELEEALDGAGTLLSGTGWASDLEHRARSLATQRSLVSIAVIDHWVNYAERFVRNGVSLLPSQIWVTDGYARRIAADIFPRIPVHQMANLYLEQQRAAIMPPPAGPPTLLYVAEPMRTDWQRGVAGEFQALDFLVARLTALALPDDTKLLLRLHPSEPEHKYDAWIAKRPELIIEVDRSATLAEAISRCHWVAGCESYALVVALGTGRKVFCALPPWAPACRLPHSALIHAKDFGVQL